jgi:hypothetical protein
LASRLGQDGDHAGGTPVGGPVVTRRRRRRVTAGPSTGVPPA